MEGIFLVLVLIICFPLFIEAVLIVVAVLIGFVVGSATLVYVTFLRIRQTIKERRS